jgi:hypothetical protein
MRSSFAAFLTFLTLAAGPALAQAGRPVVVELFTSQGCSSCPPADVLLAKLAKRKDVLAMSLPITYWDMLGWKDTLASDDNTKRQKAYAAEMGRGGVYTPQIIVEGTADMVGSQDDAVEAAIAEAENRLRGDESRTSAIVETSDTVKDKTREPTNVAVSLSETPRAVHVAVAQSPSGKAVPEATIWAFRLRSSVTVTIRAGENAGHTMTYTNVVSEIRNLGRWSGKSMSLDLPHAPSHDGVAVVLQQGGYGRVIGAAYLVHADYYAEQ